MQIITVVKILSKGIYLVQLNYCELKSANDADYVLKK